MTKGSGWTIIESFLIAILLGCIIAGMLKISNLDRNSNIKKSVSQLNEYEKSINIFEKKYGHLPGDVNKTQVLKLSKQNTNGNTDGLINIIVQENIWKARGETINMWHHLYNSKIITEYFDGKKGVRAQISNTIPKLFIRSIGWTAFSRDKENYFILGVSNFNKGNINLSNNSFTPIEAFLFDKKIDDGLPLSGKMQAAGGNNITSISENIDFECASLREYLIRLKKPKCQLIKKF